MKQARTNRKQVNLLRCYVCGKPITDTSFRLVSLSKNVDRVFIVDNGCLDRVQDDAATAILVEHIE